MNEEFQVGDVVVLKSGGPKMTIEQCPYRFGHLEYKDKALCKWFDNSHICTDVFKLDALAKVEG